MRRRILSGLALALLCVSAAPAAAGAARSVAVLYFDNDTGDSTFDYLGKGLADMMVTDLAAVPDIQVVEREKLEALLQELKLQRTRYFDPKTAQKIGRGVGAEYAVAGAFLSVAPDIRIDVRVIRIGTGEIVTARKVVGQKDKFFELQQKLAAELIDGLGAAAEKAKLAQAQESTRVDDLGTAGEYGRGLDMRDRGDLKSASEQMQKVVDKAPRFALAKTRQMEILKALYEAKDTRAKVLGSSEQKLLAIADQRVKDLPHDTMAYFAFRVVRGDIFLRRVAKSLDRPAAEYRADIAAYVQNQEALLEDTIKFARAHPSRYQLDIMGECIKGCLDKETEELMHSLEIQHPGALHNTTPHGMIEDFVGLVMFGIPPQTMGPSGPRVPFKRAVCFYKLDAAYPKGSVAWLERAQKAIDEHAAADKDDAGAWKENRTIEILQDQAQVYLALGKPEEAVSRLQTVLTRYPKSKKFDETEGMLRAILSGSRTANGEPLVPPCEDPR